MQQKKGLINSTLIISIVTLIFASAPGTSLADPPGSFDLRETEGHSLIRLNNTTARVGVYKLEGRIKRLYGQAFSSGASPEESAEAFLQANAHLLGVDAADMDHQYLQPIM